MIRLLLTIILAVGVAAPAFAVPERPNVPASGESPFPWGSESPFPWKTVDGLWRTSTAPIYFRFETIRQTVTSNRFLRVRLYDKSGALLGDGIGVTRDMDQVIRARVIGKKLDAYALVRAYNRRKTGSSCGSNDCVMVVTLRDKEPVQGKDMHFIVEKVPVQ